MPGAVAGWVAEGGAVAGAGLAAPAAGLPVAPGTGNGEAGMIIGGGLETAGWVCAGDGIAGKPGTLLVFAFAAAALAGGGPGIGRGAGVAGWVCGFDWAKSRELCALAALALPLRVSCKAWRKAAFCASSLGTSGAGLEALSGVLAGGVVWACITVQPNDRTRVNMIVLTVSLRLMEPV